MILYALACAGGHDFSAWFAGSEAFDRQSAEGLVTCPICGDSSVAKMPMAPHIGRTSGAAIEAERKSEIIDRPQTTELASIIGALCRSVQASCDYVGSSFPEEARRIHYGETDPRGIYGEATRKEAVALREEGIEIAAVPWLRGGSES